MTSLNDDPRGVIYDCNMFIVKAMQGTPTEWEGSVQLTSLY